MPKRSSEATYQLIFIAAFLAVLLIPLRTLQLDPSNIEDDFYGRGYMIVAVANLRVAIGDRVFPKVIVSDDGWLIFTAENDIEDYQRTDAFTEEELARIQESLDALAATYHEQGTALLVVIAPNKNTIYPERVPSEIPVIGAESGLDQLADYLQEHGATQILDLRPALLAAKQQGQIYYATDTHWNDYGAFIAYQEIMAALSTKYPALQAHEQADFEVAIREPEALDLAENIGTTLLLESKIQFQPLFDSDTNYKTVNVGGRRIQFSSNPDASLPTAIVYHDSFFFRVIPLLGEHFSSAIFIQNYIGGGLWNLSWVEDEKPDIVIIEFAERTLHDLTILIDPEGE